MTVVDQPIYSYSDTTPQKRAVADYIDIITPEDAPLAKFLGMNGSPSQFKIVNWPETKVEWLEDELAVMTDTLAASCESDATTVQVTDGSVHHVGDQWLIDSEYIWVSSISTNTVTVVRNKGGTQASHASGASIERVGNARLQGADGSYDRAVNDISAPYNYSQIFQDDLQVVETEQAVQKYGIARTFDYQAAKRVKELTILIDKTLYHGTRVAASSGVPGMMGGLATFITNNTTNMNNAALTPKALEDAVQSAWEDGGAPDTIICNAFVKRKIKSFYEGSVRTTRDEKRGGIVIDEVETDFGVLKILRDRWCPSTKLWIVESQYLGILPLRPFFQEPLAKTGDSVKGQVIGEYTFVCKNDKAHAHIYGISTTS